jgi:Arc/MetJ family transcription regulator
MRTNVVINDDLIRKAQQLTGIKTKKDVIQAALQTLIRLQEQLQVRSLRGKLPWDGDLNEQRQGRSHDPG